MKETIKKALDKALQYKGKSYTVQELAKKLRLSGNVEIKRGKSWFSDIMEDLDKKDKQ